MIIRWYRVIAAVWDGAHWQGRFGYEGGREQVARADGVSRPSVTFAEFGPPRPVRRVEPSMTHADVKHRPMPTAKRHRDRVRTALYVEVDPDLVSQVKTEAQRRGLNQWEIVELVLRQGLPQLPAVAAYELGFDSFDKTA